GFWGRLVCLRAAIAAARLIVNDRDDLPDEACRADVHSAEEYALDPRRGVEQLRELFPLPAEERWQAHWWVATSCTATLDAQQSGDSAAAWKAKDTVELVAEEVGGDAPVRAAIVAELLPWALGYSDPVRRRVAKRGEVDVPPEELAE
ncbi:hypothetical protein OAX78_03895, partial [Planctomycetota bacterium]|nr:hypothetical protein [Planctomycetota bacterium]